jgi:hypothetical protein
MADLRKESLTRGKQETDAMILLLEGELQNILNRIEETYTTSNFMHL